MVAIIGTQIPIREKLLEFRTLCKTGMVPPKAPLGHNDGWGVGIVQEKIEVHKHHLTASEDNAYSDLIDSLPLQFDGIVLAHLRKASRGVISSKNNHPFSTKQWVFMHNGTIRYPDKTIDSDTRYYFQTLQKFISDGNTVEESYRIFNAYLKANEIAYTSITSVLASETDIYVYRDYTEDEDYYTIYYKPYDSYIEISQQPVNSDGWYVLSNKQLLHIDRENLQPSITQL